MQVKCGESLKLRNRTKGTTYLDNQELRSKYQKYMEHRIVSEARLQLLCWTVKAYGYLIHMEYSIYIHILLLRRNIKKMNVSLVGLNKIIIFHYKSISKHICESYILLNPKSAIDYSCMVNITHLQTTKAIENFLLKIFPWNKIKFSFIKVMDLHVSTN